MLAPVNPSTGKKLAEVESLTAQQASTEINKANAAFPLWRDLALEQRAGYLKAVAAAMRARKEELARLMAEEMGKPWREGLGEVEKGAMCAEYYADNAAEFLAAEELASDASHSYVCYQPLGTVLGILPWNAPVWLALRFLAPALMAGNTCVMKADSNVPGTARVLTEAFYAAGLPQDVMINLPLETPLVGDVIDHPGIKAVSFTGSSNAGKKVAARAAAGLKPAVLELGGSDPCIVLADAALDKACDVITLSRMINAGQSCIAVKRLIVEEAVYDKVCDMLYERFTALATGDPLVADSQALGPIARRDLQLGLHDQVTRTIQAGARCLTGGDLPGGEGFFYPPTLLVDVKPGMAAFTEETFGPVLAVVKAKDFDHALQLANDTEYGLGSSIWCGDPQKGEMAAQKLQAGQVAVNGIVKTDPRLPSGGIGLSGYGRELGPHGIREFVNTKQIWVA
ncbi:MAG: succinate-semialdehyde dehydrogenase [Oleibacter sp.]|nr:succinate-semialdehyde dehydrogenase [Thalassolituus sp.]